MPSSEYDSFQKLNLVIKGWSGEFLAHCSKKRLPQSRQCNQGSPKKFSPFHSRQCQLALIDFTLSNARRFYSSMGNPSRVKGLSIRQVQVEAFGTLIVIVLLYIFFVYFETGSRETSHLPVCHNDKHGNISRGG